MCPVGAAEGDHTEVMTFELKPKVAAAAAKVPMVLKKRQPTPSAIGKLGLLDNQEKALLGINRFRMATSFNLIFRPRCSSLRAAAGFSCQTARDGAPRNFRGIHRLIDVFKKDEFRNGLE